MDTFEGTDDNPISQHKYLYANLDPVDNIDPCGECVPSNAYYGLLVQERIFNDFLLHTPGGLVDIPISAILRQSIPAWQGGLLQPDLVDPGSTTRVGQVYEIKSIYSEEAALAKVALYALVLDRFDKNRIWLPGDTYDPPGVIDVEPGTIALISRPYAGVISYCLINQYEISAIATLALAGALAEVEVDVGAATLENAVAF